MPRAKKQRLKRRKDGRYCCVYHGVHFMGRTEEEALEKREEYKRQEQMEGYIREYPTVRQYAERWLPIHKAGVRKITYKTHRCHLDKLCAEIGDLYLADVKPSDIKAVYTHQYLGLSDGYIKHGKTLFAAMFGTALEDHLIQSNPVLSASAKPHKGTSGTHRSITPEERHLIETVATDHRMHAAAIVMLYAGLRPQEVKALRVEDVDFEAGVIHVRSFAHMVTHNRYEADSTGKTVKATRDVPLFAPVRRVLQGRTGYLLSSKDGGIASRMAWAKGWQSYQYAIEKHLNGTTAQLYGRTREQKAMKAAGTLPPWRRFEVVPYDLRHSFATWCRDNGVELHTCVDWMGHADAQMILKIYDDVSDARSKSEAERLEKLLFGVQNDVQNAPQDEQTHTNQSV